MNEVVTQLPEPTQARMDDVRLQLNEIVGRMAKDYITMGKLLWEANQQEYFRDWGYGSIAEFANKELDFKKRKAEYFRKIYGRFVVEMGVPEDEVLDVKWTKAILIEPLATKENVKEWMHIARTTPYSQLEAQVREKRRQAGSEDPGTQATSSDPDPMVGEFEGNVEARTFHLFPKQRRNVDRAFEEAVKDIKVHTPKPSHILDMVCLEFLANRGSKSDEPGTEIQTWLDNMKKRFPDATVLALHGTLEQRREHLKMVLEELESMS